MAKYRKVESFECDLCSVCFKRTSQLQSHVTAKHKGNNSNKTQDHNTSQSRACKQTSLVSNNQVRSDECGNNFVKLQT